MILSGTCGYDVVYVTAFIAIRQAVVYACCPTVYPFVLFTIQIRRRTLYYVVNVVGNIFEFSLPLKNERDESGERVIENSRSQEHHIGNRDLVTSTWTDSSTSDCFGAVR